MYGIPQNCKQFCFHNVKHFEFGARKKVFARNFTALLYSKKSAAEAHRILVEAYGGPALSEIICRDWFRRFKNNDFDDEDKECTVARKKFKNEELEALLH